jgi:4-diphosphocytidyl-2-C-methyl-D-erythritol kinase
MITFPNAKINIGLNILRKRTDGYHDIQSIFYPVCIKDALEIIENTSNKKSNLYNYGLQIDSPAEKNLVLKAYNKIKAKYNIPPVDIFLYKKIPFGAGLGGGSADAAFTLKMLNSLFDLNIPKSELANIAAQICADCSFFIYNQPAIVSGIGNIVKPVENFLPDYKILLVKPKININTKNIYQLIKPNDNVYSLSDLIKSPIENWKNLIFNDFENIIFEKYPQIHKIKQNLYKAGAYFASMSGSGSTVFGIFDKNIKINKNIFQQNCSIFECFTL